MAGDQFGQNFPAECYAMNTVSDIITLRRSNSVNDWRTEIAPNGARRFLAAALMAGADAFVAQQCTSRGIQDSGGPRLGEQCSGNLIAA